MSVAQTANCTVVYRFNWRRSLEMIPWYRQVLALVFGLGVMIIAIWGIDQGSGAMLIGSVVGMAFLSLLLIFGIEVDSIEIGDKFRIDFSSATTQEKVVEVSDDEDKDE